MYAVIRRYNAQTGMAAQILQRVNEGFVPLVRQLRGYVAYYVVEGSDGTLASVSIFENRESADESTELASDWVRRNIASMIRTSPVILTGELAIHDLQGAAH